MDKFNAFVKAKISKTKEGTVKQFYRIILNAIETEKHNTLLHTIQVAGDEDLDSVVRCELYTKLQNLLTEESTQLLKKMSLGTGKSPISTQYRKEHENRIKKNISSLELKLRAISKYYNIDLIQVPRRHTSQWKTESAKSLSYSFISYIYPLIVFNDSLYFLSSGQSFLSSLNLKDESLANYPPSLEGNQNDAKHVILKNTIYVFRSFKNANKCYVIHIDGFSLQTNDIVCHYTIPSNVHIHQFYITKYYDSFLLLSQSLNTCIQISLKELQTGENMRTKSINMDADPEVPYATRPILVPFKEKFIAILDADDPWTQWRVYDIQEGRLIDHGAFTVASDLESKQWQNIDVNCMDNSTVNMSLLTDLVPCPVPHRLERSGVNDINAWIMRAMLNMPISICDCGIVSINKGNQIVCLGKSRTHDRYQLYLCNLELPVKTKQKYVPITYEAIECDIQFSNTNTYSLLPSYESDICYIIEWRIDREYLKKYPSQIFKIMVSYDPAEQLVTNYGMYIYYSNICARDVHMMKI